MNTSGRHFSVNFISKTIEGYNNSFTKARRANSPEYRELTSLLNAHPDFTTFVIEHTKHNPQKKTHKGLNQDFMLDYIKFQPNRDELLADLDRVIAYYQENYPSKKEYHIISKWFLEKFETPNNPFNVKEARKAMADANWELAKKYQREIVLSFSNSDAQNEEANETQAS